MQVKVYKTSVKNDSEISKLRSSLNLILGGDDKWNFDLEDCDNILRVDSHKVDFELVELFEYHGFNCEEL